MQIRKNSHRSGNFSLTSLLAVDAAAHLRVGRERVEQTRRPLDLLDLLGLLVCHCFVLSVRRMGEGQFSVMPQDFCSVQRTPVSRRSRRNISDRSPASLVLEVGHVKNLLADLVELDRLALSPANTSLAPVLELEDNGPHDLLPCSVVLTGRTLLRSSKLSIILAAQARRILSRFLAHCFHNVVPTFFTIFKFELTIPHFSNLSLATTLVSCYTDITRKGGAMPTIENRLENPLKQLREDLGLTQARLAELAGMTPGAVLKYEQGLYENPSCNLIETLCTLSDYDRHELTYRYGLWRDDKRAAVGLRSLANIYLGPLNIHPMTAYRRAVGYETAQSFCIALCIHPSVLAKYEAGKTKTMPKMLETALRAGGLGSPDIRIIQQYGADYHVAHNLVGA
jgi:transcriptional regulator with XRE-family HTH domain